MKLKRIAIRSGHARKCLVVIGKLKWIAIGKLIRIVVLKLKLIVRKRKRRIRLKRYLIDYSSVAVVSIVGVIVVVVVHVVLLSFSLLLDGAFKLFKDGHDLVGLWRSEERTVSTFGHR